MDYCTPADILAVVPDFRKDVTALDPSDAQYQPGTDTIPLADVEGIVSEASEWTRNAFQPHYTIEAIDAYGPDVADFPPIVRACAKTRGAVLMLQRYSSAAAERNRELARELETTIAQYLLVFNGQVLRDTLGARVPTTSVSLLLLGNTSDTYAAFSAAAEVPKGTAEYARG